MITQQPLLGDNRTGIAKARRRTEKMIEGTSEFPPTSEGDETGIAAVRGAYSEEAEPIGSIPPPASLKEMAVTTIKAIKGDKPSLLIDKLGERLAFERAGTRLYGAIISKYDAFGSFSGGPSRPDLEHILHEEHEHFRLVSETIERLGGDPTAITPSANVHATATTGVQSIVVDPRTSLLQCLEMALVAELIDNDGWASLIELLRNADEGELASRFERALEAEEEHLQNVRGWLAAAQGRDVVAARRMRSEPAPRAKVGKASKASSGRPVAKSVRGARKASSTRTASRPRSTSSGKSGKKVSAAAARPSTRSRATSPTSRTSKASKPATKKSGTKRKKR